MTLFTVLTTASLLAPTAQAVIDALGG